MAERLIRLKVPCLEDLEPYLEILIANEKRGILLIAIADGYPGTSPRPDSGLLG